MPLPPFQLKEKLFVAYSGTIWRIVDANKNEYNMKTLTAMSFVSDLPFETCIFPDPAINCTSSLLRDGTGKVQSIQCITRCLP